MRFVLRYDDFGPSPISDYYRIEKALFELFFELDIPMIVGAVPLMPDDAFDPQNERFYPLKDDGERVALMRQALDHGFQLALHGYTHQVATTSVLSEFSGQPKDVQFQKISEGVSVLESCFPETKVDIFIPPWNTHDSVTVDAVGEVGLHQLSAGDNARLMEREGVVISPSYPIGSFLAYLAFYSLDDLAKLVGNGYIVITFHAYQFLESHAQFAISVDDFGVQLREILAQGFPAMPLAPDIGLNEMKPAAERRLAVRFGLFAKAHTRIGKIVLGCSRQLSKYFGRTVGRLMIDMCAQGLYLLLHAYRKTA